MLNLLKHSEINCNSPLSRIKLKTMTTIHKPIYPNAQVCCRFDKCSTKTKSLWTCKFVTINLVKKTQIKCSNIMFAIWLIQLIQFYFMLILYSLVLWDFILPAFISIVINSMFMIFAINMYQLQFFDLHNLIAGYSYNIAFFIIFSCYYII